MSDQPALPEEAATLDAMATRHLTPSGNGHMVWRRWGSGVPVVLVHGGSGSWTHWLKTIPALMPSFEVWACDLPGLGGSAMPEPPPTPTSCAMTLARGLRQLIANGQRRHVVAFSFGAHVSTLAMNELGDDVISFIISGCSALGLRAPSDMPGLPKERSTMSAAEQREVHRAVLATLMIANPTRIDDLAISLQAENVRAARFRSREFALTDDVRRGLAQVRVPLRAIWGERDAVARPSVDAVIAVLAEHHPELLAQVIPGAGHWVMYEQPQAYNAALLAMLNTSR